MIEGFKDFKLNNKIYIAEDGYKAMKFLKKQGKFTNAHKPDIILLDLNLPRKDGREVLKEIKAEEDILSTYKRAPIKTTQIVT